MRPLALLACLLFCPLLAAPAGATVVERFDLAGLVDAAELIVIAEVQQVRAAWRGGRIVTTVTLTDADALKGSSAGTVEVEVLGGEIDGLAQRVSGMAVFSPGERVAVFLRRAPKSAGWRTVGLSQGKLGLELGLTGLQWVRQFDGLSLVTQQDGQWVAAQPGLPERADLSAFFLRLHAALAAKP